MQSGRKSPSGAFQAHGLLKTVPLPNTCWPEERGGPAPWGPWSLPPGDCPTHAHTPPHTPPRGTRGHVPEGEHRHHVQGGDVAPAVEAHTSPGRDGGGRVPGPEHRGLRIHAVGLRLPLERGVVVRVPRRDVEAGPGGRGGRVPALAGLLPPFLHRGLADVRDLTGVLAGGGGFIYFLTYLFIH